MPNTPIKSIFMVLPIFPPFPVLPVALLKALFQAWGKYPVMLDWEGNISQAYKVEKAKNKPLCD